MARDHEAGTFEAQVMDHGFNYARTGTPQVWVKFKTIKGTIVGFFALTDKSATHTLKKLRAMGFQGSNMEELDDGMLLVDNPCQIEVVREEWNGKTSSKVAWVNPAGGGGGGNLDRNPEAAAAARRFNALLKKEPVIKVEPPTTEDGMPDISQDEVDLPPSDLPF